MQEQLAGKEAGDTGRDARGEAGQAETGSRESVLRSGRDLHMDVGMQLSFFRCQISWVVYDFMKIPCFV